MSLAFPLGASFHGSRGDGGRVDEGCADRAMWTGTAGVCFSITQLPWGLVLSLKPEPQLLITAARSLRRPPSLLRALLVMGCALSPPALPLPLPAEPRQHGHSASAATLRLQAYLPRRVPTTSPGAQGECVGRC